MRARDIWRHAAPLAALLACACASAPTGEGGPAALLSPWLSLPGAPLSPAADRTGTPLTLPGGGPFTRFAHPSSVAALGNDLYVADPGAGAVYHVDTALRVMTRVGAIRVSPATRLAVGPDFSLYVVSPPDRRVLRFSRDGRLLASYADEVNLAQPVDVALDASGVVLVADRVFNQVVAFNPLGKASQVFALRGDQRQKVASISAMTLAAGNLYITDPTCRCVVRLSQDGRALSSFGHGELRQPGAIAVDRYGRVFVADALDQSLSVFVGERLLRRFGAAELGAAGLSALWIDNGFLFVADGPGARVLMLRVSAPQG